MKRAFTLTELLIVVAIIGVLTAIGVVNLLGAQSRSKVSRALADMRTIATALEAYRVEHNAYPNAAIAGGDILLPNPMDRLVRPVAYLESVPTDAFGVGAFAFAPNITMLGYLYRDRATTSIGMQADTYGLMWKAVPDKSYLLHSCGPNRLWDVAPYVEYDPTNGTTSAGDISRFGPF